MDFIHIEVNLLASNIDVIPALLIKVGVEFFNHWSIYLYWLLVKDVPSSSINEFLKSFTNVEEQKWQKRGGGVGDGEGERGRCTEVVASWCRCEWSGVRF